MKTKKTVWVLVLVTLAAGLGCPGCSTLLSSRAEPFTLVMLPDTQNYADADAIQRGGDSDLRETFYRQTAWIKEHKDDLNIVMVPHVGDIVQTDHPAEWAIADTAFETIDDDVPYILCLGNHDIGRGEADEVSKTMRRTNLNAWFPPSRFEGRPLYRYGGRMDETSDNYYLLFKAGGMKFLIIAIEFKPRDEVLEWANEVLAAHPKRRCIVVTHAYLDAEGGLYDGSHYKFKGNSGPAMWDKFVKRHEGIFLVLCGHVLGESRRADPGDHGNTVHQLLADYQGMDNGGDGYLRIMRFVPKEDTIEVRSYSPVHDKDLTGDASRFSLFYRMKKAAARKPANGERMEK